MSIPLTWPGTLLESLNLLDLVSLSVLAWTGWRVWAGRPHRLLLRLRWKALAPLGVSQQEVRDRVAALIGGHTPTVASELDWLVGCERLARTDPAGIGPQQALPFADPTLSGHVAAAYASYAARLDRGILLGSDQAPVVQRDGRLARELSTWLDQRCHAESLAAAGDRLELPHRSIELEILAELTPRDLLASYRPHRLIGLASGAARPGVEKLPLSDEEEAALRRALDQPDTFDGSLPRLIDWRLERDLNSGRSALHLSVAETTYSAVKADHYSATLASVRGPEAATGEKVRLLTLAMALLTSCGRISFAKRSARAGSHRGRFGPAVSGNLEFTTRRGVVGDLDAFGMPDMRAALAREAQEELGLLLDPASIALMGLARFWCAEEKGTFVLLACAPIDLTLDELVAQGAFADPVEGAWEVDREFLGLRIPRGEGDTRACVEWLLGATDLTPHATLAGLAALAATTRSAGILALAHDVIRAGVASIPDSGSQILGSDGRGLRLAGRLDTNETMAGVGSNR